MSTHAQYPGDPAAVFPSSEPGNWMDVPFNAANFVGQGGMTWTVGPANVIANRYCRIGNLVVWTLVLVNTITGGTPGNVVLYGPTRCGKHSGMVGFANNPAPSTPITVKCIPNGTNPVFVGLGLENNATWALNATTDVWFTALYEYV